LVSVRRLEDESQLSRAKIRGGYVLNVAGSRAHLHQASCVTVGWMNPGKRGGVYHATTLDEVLDWLVGRSIDWAPCRICLPTMAYTPRPGKLTDHIRPERS